MPAFDRAMRLGEIPVSRIVLVLTVLLVGVASMAATNDLTLVPDTSSGHRYRIAITSPWDPSNRLSLMCPEHLEHGDFTQGILRWGDPGPYPWIIAADGKSATYDVTSQGEVNDPNLRIQAELTVNGLRLDLKLTFTNTGSNTYRKLLPLIDIRYDELQGFPVWNAAPVMDDRYAHHFVIVGGVSSRREYAHGSRPDCIRALTSGPEQSFSDWLVRHQSGGRHQ